MLDLVLRKEFQGRSMPGTAITLHQGKSKGAIDKPPKEFLEITYPTADVIKAMRTVREDRDGGPVVLMGGRGKGKSHLMAVLHHAVSSPDVTEEWLKNWSARLQNSSLANIKIARGFQAISETVNDDASYALWNLLFAQHKNGQFYKGKFEASNTHMPSKSLMIEMFESQPTCLILDEFQSWYDALPELRKGIREQNCAFSFIQILSEISKDRPDILMFIVSVRNNETEAFKQLHRQTPTVINFSGETAKQDRQNLILHRLFENRLNIAEDEIRRITESYAKERFRLLFSQNGIANAQKVANDVCTCWPFAPELLSLLEDQILMADAAQETRDMIRILAMVFKSQGSVTPVITSSCFSVESDSSEVQTLVDSIASQAVQEKLREIAQRNLKEIKDSGAAIPLCSEMIASIWMHSMAPGRLRGIKSVDLQLALSAKEALDDNNFRVQLGQLVENSVNIHNDPNNQLYWFEQSKNPRTEVRVAAKNDHLWAADADPNNGINHPGKDIEWMMKTLRRCFIGETAECPSEVIVLGPHWNTDPWSDVDEKQKPQFWKNLVLLVIPGSFSDRQQINAELGKWLKTHVAKRRNAVRFLIQDGTKGLFEDKDLLFLARCSYLCSSHAWGSSTEYRALRSDFDKPLERELRERFNRFAVLTNWNFQDTAKCVFDVEGVEKLGTEVSKNVEEAILKNIFDLIEFNKRIIQAAKDGYKIGEVVEDMLEPGTDGVLAFLGDGKTLELIQELTAKGEIAMNRDGTWYIRQPGQKVEDALRAIRNKTTCSGSEFNRILLGTIEAAGGTKVVITKKPDPVTPPSVVPIHPAPPTPPGPSIQHGNGATGTQPNVPDLPPAPPLPPTPAQPQVRHMEPACGQTLMRNFETWGLRPDKMLNSVRLTMNGISVQALKSVLQRIPSAQKLSLDVILDPEDKHE